ncbi:hypothetical protein [Pseudomonas sp. PD9R]|uniref:hypothetical protein n=1 Tax=Pseudomonas sp. PD9R TaxID=2853534 RepID=UPI001C442FEF|nr:hypothetical protein [Pseudomonas sp. PD9R]MBV6824927.1 hypothetical protein [Pseudomonas sp. PD9R]
MNISAAASFQIPYSQMVKPNTEKTQTEEIKSPVMDERVKLTIEKLRAPEVTGITSDDLDELEAFFRTSNQGPGFTDLCPLIAVSRYAILWVKENRAADTLRTMEGIYSDFKKDLSSKWSGLADKAFGFTVAEDGQLQVTAPPNTLTAWEKETLNTLLNESKDLQSLTLKHANAVIDLVQLDTQQFGGKAKVDLSNFHKLIDYGLLLNKGALELGETDSWLDQLHKNAEKGQNEKKQGLHIEV